MEIKAIHGTVQAGFITVRPLPKKRSEKNAIQLMSNSSLIGNLCRKNESAVFSEILCTVDCECYTACEWGKEYIRREAEGAI